MNIYHNFSDIRPENKSKKTNPYLLGQFMKVINMYNSKDFLTLYLNNEYFFEKPPLYFWFECLSCAIYGKITEFTARFPVAMLGVATSFMTYFIGRKVYSRAYGVVSSLILLLIILN